MATSSNPETRRPDCKVLQSLPPAIPSTRTSTQQPSTSHLLHRQQNFTSASFNPKPNPRRNQDKMNMTDEELDRDWKPNGRRPQSTIARSFSQELGDIFRIENSIADLDEKVDKRKQIINNHTSELEALEARIREMEQRLKQGKPTNADDKNAGPSGSPRSQRRQIGDLFADPNAPPPPPAKDHEAGQSQGNKHGGSRPGTARQSQQAVPGALPPTPVGSEGECEPPVTHSSRVTVVSRPFAPPPPRPSASSTMSSSSSTARAQHQRTAEDDSASVKSMSGSTTFADYVIVPRLDGDEDQDA